METRDWRLLAALCFIVFLFAEALLYKAISTPPAIFADELDLQSDKTVTLSSKTIEKVMPKASFDKLPVDAEKITYDDKTSKATFHLNQAIGCGWKLVHDGKNVITVQNNCGRMTTEHTIVTAKDKAAILAEIKALGLAVSDNVQEQIDMEEK